MTQTQVVIPVLPNDAFAPHHGVVAAHGKQTWRQRANSKPMRLTRRKLKVNQTDYD